jgi:hypothetical protein
VNNMKKYLFIVLLTLLLSIPVLAADYCVSPNGNGGKTGADWNNTIDWSSLTPARGNVYYLEDGSYENKNLSTAESGSTYIEIKKATSGSHVTSTGWTSGKGDGRAQFWSPMRISSDYWKINGVQGSGDDAQSYGFSIYKLEDCTQRVQFYLNEVNYVEISYVEIEGCGSSYVVNQDIIYSCCSGNTNMKISHCYLHEAGHFILTRRWENSIFEYNYFKNNWSTTGHHGESISADHEVNNTYRYNIFDNACHGSGCVHMGLGPGTDHVNTGNKFYGNLIFGTTMGDGGNGTFSCGSDHYCNDYEVYNNTMVNLSGMNAGFYAGKGSGWLCYNNLWYNCDNIMRIAGTHDYSMSDTDDAFIAAEDHDQDWNGGSGLFLNYSGKDYRLAQATNAGKSDLGSPYNVDMLGNTRGDDGTWDRGAYEFGSSGGDTTPPYLSGAFPSIEQDCSSNPRSVTIGVTAVDPSTPVTCKYDTSDIAYASMTGTLTGSGTTFSKAISDLPCDSTQTFYVRCSDSESNVNTSSTVISFPIAEEGEPPEVCTGDDEFTGDNGSAPAASRWINTEAEIQNNKLQVRHTAANGKDYVTSSWATSDDFEVQFDFDVSAGPETNSWEATMNLVIDSTHQVQWGIEYASSTLRFSQDYIDGAYWDYATETATNTYGSLKIVKVSNTFRCYYRDGTGAWTAILGSASYLGEVGQEMYLEALVEYRDNNPDVTVTFDNFQFNSGCIEDEPVISDASPFGEQECTEDPRSVDISLATNENCTCKYDTSDVAYGSMGNTYTGGGGKAHTATLADLPCEAEYTIYSRCSDAGSVLNSESKITYFTIGESGADTTPPVISNALPSGVQTCSENPRDITISVVTNELATCKYSLDGDGGDDENTAYDDLNNTFSTTGGTSHSQLLNLACGASYQYWVRCQDDEGTPNQNVASEEISFSISSGTPPDPVTGLTIISGGMTGGGIN